MPLNDRIIFELKRLMEIKRDLELLVFYKELPFTSKATLVNVSGERATFKVSPPGSVCLEWENQAWILSGEPMEAIRANVDRFDITSGLVELSEFTYVGSKFGRRMIVRVAPKSPLAVEIVKGDQKLTAELVDISMGGVGLSIPDPEAANQLNVEDQIQMTILLPDGKAEVIGKVQSIGKVGDSGSRLSVIYTESSHDKGMILKYIANRRIEIVQELRQLYETTYQKKTSPNAETLMNQ